MRLLLPALLAAVTAHAAEAATPERGETLVRRHCGGCHAVGRTGKSPFPAAPPMREFYKHYQPDALAEALAEGILTGHPAMPEFRFSPDDVRSVILYLNSIQSRQSSALDRGAGR